MNELEEYRNIKKYLKDIEMRLILPNDLNFRKKMEYLKYKNLEKYEYFLNRYICILENLVISEKDYIINIILDKINKYGKESLSENELIILENYG